MKSLLTEWWDQPRLVATVGAAERVRSLKAWANQYEKVDGLACLKHPLLSLSAPDLDVAWGTEYRAIRAVRPLQQSIDGLRRRGWCPGQEERIQNRLFAASEAYFSSKAHLKVWYHELLVAPQKTVGVIAEFLGLSCDDGVIELAAACVKSVPGSTELRHG